MKKILYSKEKNLSISRNKKKKIIQKSRFYYVDDSQDFNCNEGLIKKDQLKYLRVKTNLNKEFFVFNSTFYDDFRHIKRGAQIITPKDIGIIITESGLNKNSTIVEGGSGSGALACYLAKIVKKVISYEIKKENQDLFKKNIKKLKIKNIILKLKDITKEIDEKNVDAIILDIPQPWNALKNAYEAVKVGGFIIAYCPTITQISNFLKNVKKNDKLCCIKTIELIEREWKVEDKIIRPVSESIGHTAFLTFIRRVN